MHQEIETLTSSADKRNAFEWYGRGWDDCLRGVPMSTGPFAKLSEKQHYMDGYRAAQRALAQMMGIA